jgi:hypothetical protein
MGSNLQVWQMRKKSPSTQTKLPKMSRQERDLLYKLYIEKNWTAEDVAAKLGVSVRLVYSRLNDHGIMKSGCEKRLRYCPTCGQVRPNKG